MKQNIFSTMLIVTAIMIDITSCSNNDVADNGNPADSGKPTFMELLVSFRVPGTYAADDYATPEESAVKTVTAFIFNKTSGLLVSKENLAPGDFTTSIDGQKDVYTATKKIATTTGPKSVYVGVNLPASFDMPIGATVSDMKTAVMTASANDLTSVTPGFTMFSAEDKEATLVETTDPTYANANTVKVPVERLSVKVAIQAANGLSLATGGGVLSDLQFAIRQSNTKMYRYKNVDGGVVKDPNWDTYNAADFESVDTYVDVNAANITQINQLVARYATENTSQTHLEKEITYASVRANFVPDEFLDGAGVPKGSNVGQNPKTFWLVKTDDGVKNYFESSSEADAYMAIPTVAAKNPVKSDPYTDGVCYYNMFLNPNGNYNAIRNAFYKATITQIIAPGNPSVQPQNPDEPVETPTDIQVNFEILPWNLVEWNQILQ